MSDRMDEFKNGVALAIKYATALDCDRVNCLAGILPQGVDPAAGILGAVPGQLVIGGFGAQVPGRVPADIGSHDLLVVLGERGDELVDPFEGGPQSDGSG